MHCLRVEQHFCSPWITISEFRDALCLVILRSLTVQCVILVMAHYWRCKSLLKYRLRHAVFPLPLAVKQSCLVGDWPHTLLPKFSRSLSGSNHQPVSCFCAALWIINLTSTCVESQTGWHLLTLSREARRYRPSRLTTLWPPSLCHLITEVALISWETGFRAAEVF